MDEQTPLERAISVVGTQQKLADLLGIKSASISEWRARNRVPAERVLAIEAASGVSRYQLREDVFGRDPADAEQDDAQAQEPAQASKAEGVADAA